MKQRRSLSEFSCLSEFSQLSPRLGLINRDRNDNRLAVQIMIHRLFITRGGGGGELIKRIIRSIGSKFFL